MYNSPPVLHENVPDVGLTTAIVTGNYSAVYSMYTNGLTRSINAMDTLPPTLEVAGVPSWPRGAPRAASVP